MSRSKPVTIGQQAGAGLFAFVVLLIVGARVLALPTQEDVRNRLTLVAQWDIDGPPIDPDRFILWYEIGGKRTHVANPLPETRTQGDTRVWKRRLVDYNGEPVRLFFDSRSNANVACVITIGYMAYPYTALGHVRCNAP